MADIEECRNCGQRVLMMCQKWTGFCSQRCENTYEGD